MQTFAGLAIAFLIGVSTVVAVRLLLLHRRTGAWPELWLGAMLLLSVGVGYPLNIASTQVGPEWSSWLVAVSAVITGAGFSLLFGFTCRVFRPHDAWARALAAGGSLVLMAVGLYHCVRVAQGAVIDVTHLSRRDVLLLTVPIALAYAWTSAESFRYYGVMRRRSKLGLADESVTNRFLLWGLMAFAAMWGVLLNAVAGVLEVNVLQTPWVFLLSTCTGLAQTACMVLAFLPPRSYVEWVRARAEAAG